MDNSIASLIADFSDIAIIDTKSNNITFIDSKSNIYPVELIIKDINLSIKPDKNADNSTIHLVNIINTKNFTNINNILDLLEFVREIINNSTNYCVGCHKKMEYQSKTHCNCGQDSCVYKFEELKFGDPVLEKCKQDPDIFKFLITSSTDAISCARKFDIFEPFPQKFLTKEALNIERGQMSKLTNANYDKYKDFTKLNNLLSKFNLDLFVTNLGNMKSDTEIETKYGEDLYILIRFIIMSCKVDIILDTSFNNALLKNSSIYKITHPLDQETTFNKLKPENNPTQYLFHGSNWSNWYSIMRNGLKNCSKSKLMTAGAAYGDGVYLSDSANMSYGYGLSGSKSIIGVFEVLGDMATYKKSHNIFVVADDKVLIQRFLIIIKDSADCKVLDTIFMKDIIKDNIKEFQCATSKGIKKLIKEYKQIQDSKLGFRLEVDPDNMYKWVVYLDQYDTKYPIGQDMEKYKIKEICLEILFPTTYPFSPPFVRVVSPRFKHLSGHVTTDGALCMEILTPKGWSPACSLESLLVTIRSEILEGEGRLDPVNYNMAYSLKEAQDSFIRVAKGHGWL